MAERGEQARQLALRAARQVGLDSGGARVFRVRSSVQVELPEADVVARVESPAGARNAARQVRAAHFYEARGAPVVRLAHPQPLVFEHGVVTLWQRLHPVGRDPDEHQLGLGELGQLLRVLHERAGPPLDPGLPPINPFDRIGRDLARPVMDPGQHRLDALRRRYDTLRGRWTGCVRRDPSSDQVLVHGDVHPDNVMVTAEGPCFVDLELAGAGPADWDLAMLTVNNRRYGLAEAGLEAFLAGYGADPRGQDAFELFCQTYELIVVAWALHCADLSPRMLREARVRVATLLGESDAAWTML